MIISKIHPSLVKVLGGKLAPKTSIHVSPLLKRCGRHDNDVRLCPKLRIESRYGQSLYVEAPLIPYTRFKGNLRFPAREILCMAGNYWHSTETILIFNLARKLLQGVRFDLRNGKSVATIKLRGMRPIKTRFVLKKNDDFFKK